MPSLIRSGFYNILKKSRIQCMYQFSYVHTESPENKREFFEMGYNKQQQH